MKNSGVEWIGEIPEDWEVVKFKNLHSGTNVGESIDKDFCSDNEEGFIFYTAGLEPIHTSFTDFPLWKYTKENDLLLARNGTPYVYFPLQNAVYSDHIIRVSINNNYSKSFVKYAIEQSISNTVVDTVSIATWSASLWNTQKLPLPPKSTQQRIASYLDKKCSKIEETIQNQQQVIEKLKAYKQSLITEAVTGKIKIQNGKVCGKYESYKDSGVEWIGKIPSGWEAIKAKYFIKISNGSDPKTEEGDTPVYGSGAESFKTCVEFKEGPTVLIGRKGATLHIPHYIEGNYWNVDTAFDVKTYSEEALLLKFYYYCATAFDYKFYLTSTTLPSMTQTNYGNMYLPVSNSQTQKEIVEFLNNKCTAIDTSLEQKQELIEKLTEYKKSLIYECVTGKKEI